MSKGCLLYKLALSHILRGSRIWNLLTKLLDGFVCTPRQLQSNVNTTLLVLQMVRMKTEIFNLHRELYRKKTEIKFGKQPKE